METLLSLLPIPLPPLHFHTSNSPKTPLISPPNHPPIRQNFRFKYPIITTSSSSSHSQLLIPNCYNPNNEEESIIEELRVPQQWLEPSKAMEESEWLRVALHKWLDDEYCPEPTNVIISRVAAQSYYSSLLQKTTDLGQILLNMVTQLESISYQDSFHGAFSSANAAVSLISQKIEELD